MNADTERDPAPVAWTWWPALREPEGIRGEADAWPTLWAMLRASAHRPHDERGWSPATYAGDRRAAATVERVYAVGADVDKGGDPARVADALSGLAAFIHTTRSHRPDAPRCRAIVPLANPTDAAGHGRAWRALAARLARAGVEVDQATKDASRLWFLPSLPAEGEPTIIVLDGAPLPVPLPELEHVEPPVARPPVRIRTYAEGERAVLAAAKWLERAEPAVAGQHGHDRTFVVARALVHKFALPAPVALALLRQWNRSCVPPWADADLERKVEQARHARAMPEPARALSEVSR